MTLAAGSNQNNNRLKGRIYLLKIVQSEVYFGMLPHIRKKQLDIIFYILKFPVY